MKTNIIFLLLFFCVQAFGQIKGTLSPLDSLKQKFASAQSDTDKVLILEKMMWVSPNLKSSLEFGEQGLALAKRIHYYRGIIICGNSLGYFFGPNNYYNAVTILTETKQIAEKHSYKLEQIQNLGTLGYAYSFFDFQTSLQYFRRCKALMDENNMPKAIPIYFALGYLYIEWGPQDSALFYIEKAYQHDKASKNFNPNFYYMRLGEIYYKKNQADVALNYFRGSIAHGAADETYYGISQIYSDKGYVDSAAWYAKKALKMEQENNSNIFMIRSADLLFNLYKTSNPSEALKYHLIASAAKDSLFNQEKAKQAAKLVFQERERDVQARQKLENAQTAYHNKIRFYSVAAALVVVLLIAVLLYRNNLHKQKSNAVLQQKNKLIETTLQELKSTQAQLIQSEKMASLGELTAGIAHEIQNPLNFVNNFSEVSRELIEELKSQKSKLKSEEQDEILNDIDSNLEKVLHHGKRADAIVKGMLQHSRQTKGVKEPTDINALCDEYLRLSFHGLRAKDKNFNADFKTDFDESFGKVNIVPQDIGRVLLNLFNNAFYATNERRTTRNSQLTTDYKPLVFVTTRKVTSPLGVAGIEIIVTDNGNGIPQNIIDKIFQPFFTTKPTGQGTGLGLSLAYDIITKEHNGTLQVESKEGQGSSFIIHLPVIDAV